MILVRVIVSRSSSSLHPAIERHDVIMKAWGNSLLRCVFALLIGISGAFVAATVATAQTTSLAPPQVYHASPTGVNFDDSRYVYSTTDLSVGPLTLTRSYLSGPQLNGSQYFGSNWTHNYDVWLASNCPSTTPCISVVVGRTTYKFNRFGSIGSYQFWADGTAVGTTLEFDGTTYLFTDRQGTKYQFTASVPAFGSAGQRLASVTSANGHILTLTYDSSNHLKIVSSNQGYALVFDYESHGYVSAACGFNLTLGTVGTSSTCSGATLKTAYSYATVSGVVRLSSFTDVLGNSASVGSVDETASTPTCVIYLPGGACRVAFSGDSVGLAQTLGDGTVWHFAAVGDIDFNNGPTTYESMTMIDPNGGTFKYAPVTDYSTGKTSYYTIDQLGHTTNVDTYGGFDMLFTLPEGNKVQPLYNTRYAQVGNTFIAKPGTSLSDITQGAATFPTPNSTGSAYSPCDNPITCNEPLTVTDGNGNVTTYTYDSTHGGVLTETSPANGAGVSAVVRHAYAQKYAYIKNSGGTYSAAATPIWLRTEDRSCNTTATVSGACAGGSTDEVVTSYDYGPASGPNNLLLRGKAVTAWDPVTSSYLTLRTCYTYDWMGNKVSETSPRANLSSCS